MITMLLFWLVYGAWMVFSWAGMMVLFSIGVGKVLGWITDGDYTLESYVDRLKHLADYNLFSNLFFIFGGIVTIVHTFVMCLDAFAGTGRQIKSFHEVAVIISEWTSTTMQTPLLIVLALTGVVVLLKKGYPLFKKIKTLTDTLNGNK